MHNWTDFYEKTKMIRLERRVNSPWTAKEIIRDTEALTIGVVDCSAGGIVTYGADGKSRDVVMFHLCPTRSENSNFSKIAEILRAKLGELAQGERVQGFLVGGAYKLRGSKKMFTKLKNFMTEQKIPCTILENQKDPNGLSIAYRAGADEWLVTNYSIEKALKKGASTLKKILSDAFNYSNILDEDVVC